MKENEEHNNEMVGNFPIRQDIKQLVSKDREMKIGWKIDEIPPGKTDEEYYKEKLSEEDFEKWQYSHSVDRLSETDRADYYREDGYNGGLGRTFIPSSYSSFGFIYVLKELWGQPWNNLALNYISTLKPSSIRVSTGNICLDSHPNRLTVILEKDNRTIKDISMEVVFNAFGGFDGEGLRYALHYQKENGSLEGCEIQRGSRIYINDKAISKIDFEMEGD